MGWKSVNKNGEIRYEDHADPELGGRPVQQGEEGNLLAIIQEDYGHLVVIDLMEGFIAIDPSGWEYQNGRVYIHDAKTILWVCDDTNIVGEMAHVAHTFELKRDEQGRKVHDEKGKLVETKTDVLTPLTFRPIWFSRHISTLPAPIKVVGLQTTLPELQGGANLQMKVMLYSDGRIGIG